MCEVNYKYCRYIIFAYYKNKITGGTFDILSSHDNIDIALKAFDEYINDKYDIIEIFDCDKRGIIKTNYEFKI